MNTNCVLYNLCFNKVNPIKMLSVFEKLENIGETNLNPLMRNIPKRSGEDNLLVIPSPFTMRKKQQQISA